MTDTGFHPGVFNSLRTDVTAYGQELPRHTDGCHRRRNKQTLTYVHIDLTVNPSELEAGLSTQATAH